MTSFIIFILLSLCIGQSFYIYHMKKHEKGLLDILRSIRHGGQDKIFTKGKGQMAEICYEINGIIDANQEQIAQLKKADEANKQILTSLSHDVRTPLASLLGYLEALEKGISDRTAKQEYVSVALRKANDLKSYVDMIFEWFKLNSNEQQFSFETVDINELTREVIIEWLPVLERESVTISADIGDNELLASIDCRAYSRIFGNLIQNAIRHGRCTEISVGIKCNSDTISISVVNNGQVIPEQQLPHIFGRLYKGDHTRSNKGSGLGLAITKELVTNLCGQISACSSQVNGTKFEIKLPILK